MKLKYKLFISYLLLISFFSIALFLIVLQTKAIDRFVRLRIEQDVQEVIDLSRQQQILEDVYAQYILTRLPGPSQSRYRENLKEGIHSYQSNWDLFRSRRQRSDSLSISPVLNYFLESFGEKKVDEERIRTKTEMERQCESLWTRARNKLTVNINSNEHVDPGVKNTIANLRKELGFLSELIGEQAHQSGNELKQVSETINLVVIYVLLIMVLISLFVAFFVARLFSRPLEDLKNGIDQVAIQNFNVRIPKKSNDEIGELASAFEQMALRLNQNDKFKSEMLNQFTHEMKSPLAAIYQAMSLLEHSLGSNPTENQKRLLSIINGNNETLSSLITNILHSASYDSENMRLDLQNENIVKLFTNTIMKLAPTVKKKDMKVDLNFSSEKININLDKDRLEEVFTNLLTNAIKFSSTGSKMQVSIFENDSFVNVQIRDQGIGIPAKEVPYIFEKMYRASNSTKISVKGTGLGLYITSQIVKAHGGKIKVKSKLGAGTEFTVLLPLENEKIKSTETEDIF
jgi:signal transduction histidine kinase